MIILDSNQPVLNTSETLLKIYTVMQEQGCAHTGRGAYTKRL